MKYKLLNSYDPKIFAIILDEDDQVEVCIQDFARYHEIKSAQLTAIGAFKNLVVGYFDLESRTYEPIVIDEQVEVLNLSGDVSIHNNKPVVHMHVVVAKRDGTAHGGHLLKATVRPTLEIVLTESPVHLVRKMNPEFGIPLIEI